MSRYAVGDKVIISGTPAYAGDSALPIGSIGTIIFRKTRYQGEPTEYVQYVVHNEKANTIFGKDSRGTVYEESALKPYNPIGLLNNDTEPRLPKPPKQVPSGPIHTSDFPPKQIPSGLIPTSDLPQHPLNNIMYDKQRMTSPNFFKKNQ
jgi:hypothetical protein